MFDLGSYSLRSLVVEDQALLLRWRNSERVRRNMYTNHVIGEDEHAHWFASVLSDPGRVVCRIFLYEGRSIGFVSFSQIDREHRRCSWAFYLGEEDVPRGAGSVLEFLALEFAFGELGIRKLCCEVFAFNAGVIKLHEKFGFIREGCMVDHYVKGEGYESVILLALFADEWQIRRESLMQRLFGDQ